MKGDDEIQGMIAVQYDDVAMAVHAIWGCTAPHNNVWTNGKQKYSGVGGHLFAIASELSYQHGYDGFVYGEAADRKLYEWKN